MLSVHSDWFGKLGTTGETRQGKTPTDCKEMFVPSDTTAAIHRCFQSATSIYHQLTAMKIHFLSMTGDLVEGGHKEAAHGTTAKALGSCLLTACPLAAKALVSACLR